MLVIVVNASDGNKEVVIDLPTPAEQTLATLKARCSSEFGIAENEMSLTFAGMSITAEAPLNSQMTDGATLTLQKVAKRKFFLHDIPPNANAETLLSLCDEHEGLLGQLMEVDTELGTALTSKDVPKVRLLLMKRMMSAHKGSFAKQQELNKLHSDPDNPENQRRMMELIQEEEIKKAHEMAMEENPESFAQVYMLYVNLAVQGVPIKAFVDSGAQMTIMSKECAEKVGILRLMDKRFAGLAVGVGSQKILGKVHMVQLQFGKSFFPAAITILEDASMDMIFGLDNLKRYRCAIDLKRNVLRLEDGSGGAEEAPFLSEAELPKSNRAHEAIISGKDDGNNGNREGNGKESDGNGSSAMDTVPPIPPSEGGAEPGESAKVAELMALGFEESQARGALGSTGGDVQAAANLLFASGGSPR